MLKIAHFNEHLRYGLGNPWVARIWLSGLDNSLHYDFSDKDGNPVGRFTGEIRGRVRSDGDVVIFDATEGVYAYGQKSYKSEIPSKNQLVAYINGEVKEVNKIEAAQILSDIKFKEFLQFFTEEINKDGGEVTPEKVAELRKGWDKNFQSRNRKRRTA